MECGYKKSMCTKNEISVKLGLNDILNQNRGYQRNFSTYKFTESYYNTLKRILVTDANMGIYAQ